MKTLLPTIVRGGGDVYPMAKEKCIVGSLAELCDIVISDATVAPIHCEIEKTADGFAVRELQTNIGLLVDGVPVTKGSVTPLHDGSVITIADETLTFEEPKTLFTDDELKSLDDLAVKIGRGDSVASETAADAVALLQDKIKLIASSCGVAVGAQVNADAVENKSEKTTEPETAEADFDDVLATEDTQQVESVFASRKKPEDQIDETKVFENKVDETNLPTICFLTPTPETTKQFREKAICVKTLPFTIGADPDNDYVMDNTFRISAKHAEILQSPSGGFELKNLDSRYGTYVDGKLIQPEAVVPIAPGNIITFGTHQYRVENI